MKHILKTGDLPALDDYGRECLYHCVVEKNYINGIHGMRVASGRAVFDKSAAKLTLTKAGLDFCWKPIPFEAWLNVLLTLITIASVGLSILRSL